jgi:hypothetical protein
VPTERTVLVRLKADVGSFQRGMAEAAAGVGALRKEINTTNDRTAWLTQGILALAPAAVTLGAGAVPAIAGVTTQMGVAAAAAGVLALGFHGVGDALKALNDYQLDPTDAHLKKLNITMQKIGPAGAEFVHFLDSLGPVLNELSNTARAGMFPGIEDGITSLMRLAPEVKRVVAEIADGIGQLASEGGKNLAGPKFREFFQWLESDAKPILLDMGRTVGNVFEGLVNLFLAFTGESAGFSKGLLDMARSFAEWSRTLDTNQSFQNFLDYVDKSGPQALAFLGALIQSLAAVVAAAAPVGSIMLPALTELLKIFAQVASTPLGSTLIALGAAMSLYGRTVAIGTNLTSGLETRFGMVNAQAIKTTFSIRAMTRETGTWARAAGRVGGQAALLGIAASGVADQFHLGNTAALAMAGSLAGPWGAAVGGGVGLLMDLTSAHDDSAAASANFAATLNQETGAITKNTTALAAKTLQEDGAFEAANALGLSLHTVTLAALGNKNAISEVNGELAFYLNQTTGMGGQRVFADPEQNQAARTLAAEIGHVTDRVKEDQKQVRELSSATHGAITSTNTFAERQRRLRDALKAARDAAQTSVDQFDLLGSSVDDAKVSLHDWITQMQKTADALANFGTNARKAADKGLKEGLIKQLEALGPAGALRMRQLANASETEIGRANRAFGSFERAGKTAIDALTAAARQRIVLNVDTSQAMANLRVMQYQIDQLHGNTVMIRTTGGHVTPGSWATGGFTGEGAKYEPAGIVHKNELVLPKEVVDRDWSFLKARYGYLPGFADGGMVGVPQRASRGGGAATMTLDIADVPVRGVFDVNTGAFEGRMRVIARSEIDADNDFDQKRANQ